MSLKQYRTEEIFYALLRRRQIESGHAFYTQVMNDPAQLAALEAMADAFECSIIHYQGTLYLYVQPENRFLGYSRADLKKRLLKSGESAAHYYLQMFILLSLLIEFYGTQYGDGRSRDFIQLGTLMNKVQENLAAGMKAEKEQEEQGKRLQIPFESLHAVYSSLEDAHTDSRRKGTKMALYMRLIDFLQEQKLIHWMEEGKQIRVTSRMNALVSQVLRRDEGYRGLCEMMEEIEDANDE